MKVGDKMPSVVEGVIIENCNGTINLGDKYNVQPIETIYFIEKYVKLHKMMNLSCATI